MSEPSHKKYEAALEIARDPERYAEALELLLSAHDAGSGDASYAIGNWYFHGRHLNQCFDKAIEYWEVAAERNNVDGLTELAKTFEGDSIVPQDLSQALYLYCRAALLGDAASMHDVGRFFYFGIGVNADRRVAEAWFEAAESNGYVDLED